MKNITPKNEFSPFTALALYLALAAPVALGVATIGTASTANAAVSYNTLNGWNGFAEETATPVPPYSQNIDWTNLYPNSVSYSLREWNGFAEETATPAPLYSQNINWNNLYR